MVVEVDVDVDAPFPSGSLADAIAATELETNPGSAVVAVPDALCVAASVVPAALAAIAVVVPAAYNTSRATKIFLDIFTSDG